MASALRKNKTLQTLDIGDNQIGDQGATNIAAALRTSTSLTSLQLQPSNDLHSATPGLAAPERVSGFAAVTHILRGTSTLPPWRAAVPLPRRCIHLYPLVP